MPAQTQELKGPATPESAFDSDRSISLPCSNLGVRRRALGGGWQMPLRQREALWIASNQNCPADHRSTAMRFLGYAYRFLSNFVFLMLAYLSLNFMEKYQQRAIVAILVLVYAAMRSATALRSFYFFQRIERLELEARRLANAMRDGPATSAARRQIVSDVEIVRRDGEMKSYIDLLFLVLVVLLCVSKIVTD
jgi:hypothetical protein